MIPVTPTTWPSNSGGARPAPDLSGMSRTTGLLQDDPTLIGGTESHRNERDPEAV
jgi:hypothetical protein